MGRKVNVLFVCTGNTCRSVLAKAFLEGIVQNVSGKNIQVNVFSAGVAAVDGLTASREALQVLQGYGIDFREHRSSRITPELVEKAHYIFTMTYSQKDYLLKSYPGTQGKIWLLSEYAGGHGRDVSDPFGRGIDAYRQAAAEIREALHAIIALWDSLEWKGEK